MSQIESKLKEVLVINQKKNSITIKEITIARLLTLEMDARLQGKKAYKMQSAFFFSLAENYC